jgi:hypothetical protein
MDVTLIASGVIVAVGAVLAASFLPRRPASPPAGRHPEITSME